MGKFIDLIGQKFNKLTVISRAESRRQPSGKLVTYWNRVCDCGNKAQVRGCDLKDGHVSSCGCSHIKHGYSHKEKLYSVWQNMKRRCYETTNKRYKNYGGRGIKVCDKWLHNYIDFRNWAIGNGYKDGLTIDRINVDGNYEPSNCRWVTLKDQQNNTTRNRILEYKGLKMSMAQFADKYNISYSKFNKRIQMGWNIEKIIKELGNEVQS